MDASENNNETEGSSNKEESSYNEVMETFVEPPVPPPQPLLGSDYIPLLFTNSEARPRTHTQPLSEQSGLSDVYRIPQQVNSNSSGIERNSLSNTGSSNRHGGMVRRRLHSP